MQCDIINYLMIADNLIIVVLISFVTVIRQKTGKINYEIIFTGNLCARIKFKVHLLVRFVIIFSLSIIASTFVVMSCEFIYIDARKIKDLTFCNIYKVITNFTCTFIQ